MKKATIYQHWIAGRLGNFGSFQTRLFEAYSRADSGNSRKLESAFPEWFTEEIEA